MDANNPKKTNFWKLASKITDNIKLEEPKREFWVEAKKITADLKKGLTKADPK